MENTFYFHRIQKDDGNYTKGIEVHTSLDDAIRSFWGRMKTAYNNPQNPGMSFVSCFISDVYGTVIMPYKATWLKEESEDANVFFLHTIRLDGETYTKAIDVCGTMDEAQRNFAAAMEYGYNNPRFPDVQFVSCEITDLRSGGLILARDAWRKAEQEPEMEAE